MLLVSGDAGRRLRGRSPAGSGSSDATFPWQDARRRHSEYRRSHPGSVSSTLPPLAAASVLSRVGREKAPSPTPAPG